VGEIGYADEKTVKFVGRVVGASRRNGETRANTGEFLLLHLGDGATYHVRGEKNCGHEQKINFLNRRL